MEAFDLMLDEEEEQFQEKKEEQIPQPVKRNKTNIQSHHKDDTK